MVSRPYLLDTSVLLTLINGKALAQQIDADYGLRASPFRPLVCVVTHGELLGMARKNRFDAKRIASIEQALAEVPPAQAAEVAPLRSKKSHVTLVTLESGMLDRLILG